MGFRGIMESISYLMDGFAVALTWEHIFLAALGAILGTIIGALPGLGPSNGVAVLIPIAFTLGLDATAALILLTSVYYGAMYGGRISSILLKIPGDEPALMTTLDGYPMAQQGRAGEALTISGLASFVGAFVATVGLVFFTPLLVKVALLFTPAEYLALFVLAFATLGGVGSKNQAKSAFAGILGLGIAMIGIDGQTGVARLSFNNVHLYDGIDFLVVIIGLFALSELFIFLEERSRITQQGTIKPVTRLLPDKKTFLSLWPTMGRGTFLGFIAGVLPGAGASLGSFISYSLEKRFFDKKKTFGTGDPRGVAAPEAGNNAAAGGALVPMLALGVPGSGTTAVLLAVLLTLNIHPGPLLFQKNPDVVWGLIAALFIANIILLLLNLPMVKMFVKVLQMPLKYLMPGVVMICFVGIYGLTGSVFELELMIIFGILGFILRKLNVPLVPVIMGVLLGNLMEDNLRRALAISDGDWSILFSSPLAIGLWGFAFVGFILPMLFGRFLRPKEVLKIEE